MKTILYYTSNKENPRFESKIIQTLIENNPDLPIISVSQKPMDLGENICVGDVGLSYLNLYRQQLIGARAAKTEYLVFAESDFLYPPEYFEFNPSGGDVYLYDNLWIVFKNKIRSYRRKNVSHGAQVVKREFLINRLEKGLKGLPEWFDGHPVPWLSHGQKRLVQNPPHELFTGSVAAVSFKTGDGVRKFTNTDKGIVKKAIPYWGEVNKLRSKYL